MIGRKCFMWNSFWINILNMMVQSTAMFGSFEDFRLERAAQPCVVFAVAADAHHEIRIVFRLFVGFAKRLLIDDRH